ncbi:MAG: TonB-dependent siderophore receptor [Rhodocyclaceae bacterium]|nr:TonB-dependent siderophore receptor [Rhodocyclaceae bacterium]
MAHCIERGAAPPALRALIALSASASIWAQAQTAPADTTLPEVRVKDAADAAPSGLQGGVTRVGKLPQLPRDVPQALTVLPRQLIEETNANTLKEALRNVAGLTFNAAEGGRIGDNMNLRGFYSFGDLYLDGIRDTAQYNRETFNLNQVDVLRGSAAMLFGRGQAGGVVNQVSKEPEAADFARAGVTLGSERYRRATADLNKGLGEQAALRLNLMTTDAGSTRDVVESKRMGVAPSLRLGIGTDDEFLLSAYYLQTRNIPDYGLPYGRDHRPLDVPAQRFYGTRSDYEDNDTTMLTGRHVHRFSRDTELRTVVRVADYRRELWAVAPRLPGAAPVTDASPINRQRQARGGEEQTYTLQSDLTTRFATGRFKHELLAGVEVLVERASRWSYNSDATAVAPPTTVGDPNPDDPLPGTYGNRVRNAINSYKGLSTGVYLQDVVELAPHWKMLAGLRRDDMRADYQIVNNTFNGPANIDFGEWSFRTGLSWQPDDVGHYYLSFSDSFNPTADLYQLSANDPFPPERSRTLELGAKWDVLDGDLSLRTSLYRAEKEWERNTDLESSGGLLSKKRHTDGLELEASGRLTRNWETFATLSFMRARIDEHLNPNLIGMRPRNTPPLSYSLWTTYKFAPHWKVGGGVEGKSARLAYAATSTTAVPVTPNIAPSYQRWDAMLAYAAGNHALRVNLFNLFNTRYYESVYENGGHVVPGAQRTLQISFDYKFF